MLILQNISYIHPGRHPLFDNLHFTLKQYDKIALTGNNGTGKSTLLKIIAGELPVSGGQLSIDAKPYYVPQVFGQFNQYTIAQALQIENKLYALKEILSGNITEENYTLLNDDWTIEERCTAALRDWELNGIDLSQKMETLSGGQKTKVFLAGISIHVPDLVLLDEPSNHLDVTGRELLYNFILTTQSTLMVVSHNRKLLNLLDSVSELSDRGIKLYGGNYDFYIAQKQIENNALQQDLQSREKALRKAKEKERETMERQHRSDARGKKKQAKAGIATIMMNTLRNNAEKSTSKMKDVHSEKIAGISQELQGLRTALPGIDQMKFGFDNAALHRGKILVTANDINVNYGSQMLWKEKLNFQITSGERIALKGPNGSGKTTLINLILNKMQPHDGNIYCANNRSVCIDQDYSLINNKIKVYEQARQFNTSALQEHEIKIRLNRFLLGKEDWDKNCNSLSGGEKMRLILCCLTIGNQSPDVIILDEPTNNLDIQNIEILTNAINEYCGTLIVVSHDEYFLKQVSIERVIKLG